MAIYYNKKRDMFQDAKCHLSGEPNLFHLLRYRPFAVGDYSCTPCNFQINRRLKQIRLVNYPGWGI